MITIKVQFDEYGDYGLFFHRPFMKGFTQIAAYSSASRAVAEANRLQPLYTKAVVVVSDDIYNG